MYIDKLEDICINITIDIIKTIKAKPADVNPSMCIDLNKENNKKEHKLKLTIM